MTESDPPAFSTASTADLEAPVTASAAEDVPFRPDLGPAPVFVPTDMARVELGQKLFYDPILSGGLSAAEFVIRKPFTGDQLADVLSRAIAAKSGSF